MQNLTTITSQEPFKAKVLQYSKSELNKVVTHHLLLYKVNDSIYLAKEDKDANDTKNDLFALVHKVGNVFFI